VLFALLLANRNVLLLVVISVHLSGIMPACGELGFGTVADSRGTQGTLLRVLYISTLPNVTSKPKSRRHLQSLSV
jgi:hypothetical protein